MSKTLKGFITYSHEDIEAKDELRKRLAVMEQNKELITWDDGQLTPGDEALQEDILKKVADSDLLLYLVSAASLASKNCNKELAEALKQELRIIPILLEHCDWLQHQISGTEVLPYKGKPINEWQPESKGWQNVVDGVREAVHEIRSQPKPDSDESEKELRAEMIFQQGNILIMFGQFDIAIEAYSDAIGLNSRYAGAYNNRGVVHSKHCEYNLAIADFNTALELKPDYVEAYNNRGNAYSKKGEFDLAIADFNTAIQLKPDYAEPYNNRSNVYVKKDESDLAIKDCDTALRLKPNYAEAYYNRGTAYGKKNEQDRAIEDFNRAIDLKPDYAEVYNNRAIAYYNKGEFDLAIEDYNIAIKRKPDYTEALDNRRVVYRAKRIVYYERNRTQFGIDYGEAVRQNPDDPNAYYNRGVAFLHLKLWGKARLDLMTAKDMGANIVASFHNFYANTTDFEYEIGVNLPEDIAAMLTYP